MLRHNPELAVFPFVSGIAGILFLVLFLGGWYAIVGADSGPVQYAVLFLVYLGTTFIASFFTAALMHETREAFEGHDPSFKSGVAAAWENRAPLFAWATIAATVGVVILTYLFGVTLGGIARTALYVYATDGTKPGEFDNVDFQRIP